MFAELLVNENENEKGNDDVKVFLNLSDPKSQLVEVDIQFSLNIDKLEFSLPVWTPGSYKVRDHAQFLHKLEVKQGDEILEIIQTNTNSWTTVIRQKQQLTISYFVEARDLTVRTSYIDSEFASLCLSSIVMLIEAKRSSCHNTFVKLPKEWSAFCPLDMSKGRYRAKNYDELIDSPLHAGSPKVSRFDVKGFNHQIVEFGKIEDLIPNRFLDDIKLICESACNLLKVQPPSKNKYIIFIIYSDNGYGGLEHDNSCVLQFSRKRLRKASGYRQLLQLIGHEYLHQWNIRRLRPIEYLSYNYSAPILSDALWFAEGVTSYYDICLPFISGLFTVDHLIDELLSEIKRYYATPGRKIHSLMDSSKQAWIKLYNSRPSSSNFQISYYNVGTIFALCLDIRLRQHSSSLSDILRTMWERYGSNQNGYTTSDVINILSEIDVKLSHQAFIWLSVPDNLPLNEVLNDVGYSLNSRKQSNTSTGMDISSKEGRFIVTNVRNESPAMLSGLVPNDEIISVDNIRVEDEEHFQNIISRREKSEILYSRRGIINRTIISCSDYYLDDHTITELPSISTISSKLRKDWLEFI